jgi:hypothetical protein
MDVLWSQFMKTAVAFVAVAMAAGACAAQTIPSIPPAPVTPVAGPVGPVTAAPEVVDLLKMLHDRKDTLKDFVANINYNVKDTRDDETGEVGRISFLMDPAKGPMFSVDFDKKTAGGTVKSIYHRQLIFDGKDLTIKELGIDGNGRTYARKTLLPPGAKPGDAVTLNGALPLPIGLDVNDVLQSFDVTLSPSTDPNLAVLKLVPRERKKFDYKQLEVTVDRKLQLPVKLLQTAMDDTETTIKLTAIEINTGKAKMLDPSTPAADGWTPMAGAP